MTSTINYVWYQFRQKSDYDNAEGSSIDPYTLEPENIVYKDSVTHTFATLGDHRDIVEDLKIKDPAAFAKLKHKHYLGLAINLKGTTKWQWVGKEIRIINSPYITLRLIDGKATFDNNLHPDVSGRDLFIHALAAAGIDTTKLKVRDIASTPNKEYMPQITDDGDGRFTLTGIAPTARLIIIYNGVLHTEASLPYNRGGDSPDQVNPPTPIDFSSGASNHLHVIIDAARFRPSTFAIKGRVIDGNLTASAKVGFKDSGKELNSSSSHAVGIPLVPTDINTKLEVFKSGNRLTLKTGQVSLNNPLPGSFVVNNLYEGDDYLVVFDGVAHDDKKASAYNRGGSTSSDQPWDEVNRISLSRKNHENVVIDPKKQHECYSIKGRIIEGHKAHLLGLAYDINGEKLMSKSIGKALTISDKGSFKINRNGVVSAPNAADIDVNADGTFEIKRLPKDSGYVVIFNGNEHTDSGTNSKSMYNRGGDSPTQSANKVSQIELLQDHLNVIIDYDEHKESSSITGRIIDGNLAAPHIKATASGRDIFNSGKAINPPASLLDETKLKVKRKGTILANAVAKFTNKTKGIFLIENVETGSDLVVIYDDGTEHAHNSSASVYNRGGDSPQQNSVSEIHLDTAQHQNVIIDIADFSPTKSISGIVIDGDATARTGVVDPGDYATAIISNPSTVRLDPSRVPCSIHLVETNTHAITTGTIKSNPGDEGKFEFHGIGDGTYVVIVNKGGTKIPHTDARRYNRGGSDPVTPSFIVIDDTTTKVNNVVIDVPGIPPGPPTPGSVNMAMTLDPQPVVKGVGSRLEIHLTSSSPIPTGGTRIFIDGVQDGITETGPNILRNEFAKNKPVGRHNVKADFISYGRSIVTKQFDFEIVDPSVPPVPPVPPTPGAITVTLTITPVPIVNNVGSLLRVKVTSGSALPNGWIRLSVPGLGINKMKQGSELEIADFGLFKAVGNYKAKAEYVVGGKSVSDYELDFEIIDPKANAKKIYVRINFPRLKPIPTDEYLIISNNKPHERYPERLDHLQLPSICKNNKSEGWNIGNSISLALFKFDRAWMKSTCFITKCKVSDLRGKNEIKISGLKINPMNTAVQMPIVDTLHDETLITLDIEQTEKPIETSLEIEFIVDSKKVPKVLLSEKEKDHYVAGVSKDPKGNPHPMKIAEIISGSNISYGVCEPGSYRIDIGLKPFADVKKPEISVDGRNANQNITSFSTVGDAVTALFVVKPGKNLLKVKIDWMPLNLKYSVKVDPSNYAITFLRKVQEFKTTIAFDSDHNQLVNAVSKPLTDSSKTKIIDSGLKDSIYPGDLVYAGIQRLSNEYKINSVKLNGSEIQRSSEDAQAEFTNLIYNLNIPQPRSGDEVLLEFNISPKEVKPKVVDNRLNLHAFGMIELVNVEHIDTKSYLKFHVLVKNKKDKERHSDDFIQSLIRADEFRIPKEMPTVHPGEKLEIQVIPAGSDNTLILDSVAIMDHKPQSKAEIPYVKAKEKDSATVEFINSDVDSPAGKGHKVNYVLIKIRKIIVKAKESKPDGVTGVAI